MKFPLVRRSSYEKEKALIGATHAAELATLQADLNLAHTNNIGLIADRDRLSARDARLTAELAEAAHERDKAIADINHWKNQTAAYQAECERLGESETALAESLCETSEQSQRVEGQVSAYRNECERLGKQVVELVSTADADAEGRDMARLVSDMRQSGARSRLLRSLYLHPTLNTPDRRAIFVLHKTASTFLWRLISKVSEIVNLPLHSPNGAGAEYIADEVSIASNLDELTNVAGLIGPFRGFVDCDLDLFSRIVVVVRDPRDILISMYYSWSRSHPIDNDRPSLVGADGKLFNPTDELRQKWIKEGPDPFVLEYAHFVESNLRLYLDKFVPRQDAVLLHYEDLIADPEAWVRSLLKGLGARSDDLDQLTPYLMEKLNHEFVSVEKENPNSHRRQMLPGDHARKLKKATIKKLNERFGFYFEAIDQRAARSD